MSGTTSGRPWQLDDADWLRRRYLQDGDRAIAQELGCAPLTVTRARQRLGIASHPNGRRRGQALKIAKPDGQPPQGEMVLTGSLAALIERFSEDQRHRTPATRDMFIARCRAYLDAEQHHDELAIDDALLAASSGALLVHQHRLKVRKT